MPFNLLKVSNRSVLLKLQQPVKMPGDGTLVVKYGTELFLLRSRDERY
jgi:hypothetical protein